MKTVLLALVAATLLCPALAAQSLEGKDAPAFTMGGVINPYGPLDSGAMAGDVIVLKVWGPN